MTEKGVLTSSRLLVQKAIASDSGLYTCEPSNANPASVRVHILNGKYTRGWWNFCLQEITFLLCIFYPWWKEYKFVSNLLWSCSNLV